YDRIGEEVDEDLPEAHRVGRDRHRLSRSSRETDVYVPLARQRADQFDGVEHDLFYEHRPRVDGDATLADGGQVERLFDEAKKVMSRSRDLLRRFPDLAVLPGLQQLRPAQDRVEGGPQLVAHAGEELVPVAARPLRRFQRLDPLGHIPEGYAHAAEVGIRQQVLGDRLEMPPFSVSPSEPVGRPGNGARLGDRSLEGADDRFAFVGMDAVEAEAPQDVVGLDAKDIRRGWTLEDDAP